MIQFEFFVEKERPTTEIETQAEGRTGNKEKRMTEKVKLRKNKWNNCNNCGWTCMERVMGEGYLKYMNNSSSIMH